MREPSISIVMASGSTQLNSHVRINCLWRCVNSMHEDPGRPFELILIDNSRTEDHRRSLNKVFDTYATVTHLIKNRINEFHGGAMRQGIAMADGNIIVTMADDTLVKPGWLEALIHPLLHCPEKKYIGALQKGPNTRGRKVGSIAVRGRNYWLWSRAGHFVWAMWRHSVEQVGPWTRRHFADTRFANTAASLGYVWTAPHEDKYLRHTNLNYMRPWRYTNRKTAKYFKRKHLESCWVGNPQLKPPVRPQVKYPLRGIPPEEEKDG